MPKFLTASEIKHGQELRLMDFGQDAFSGNLELVGRIFVLSEEEEAEDAAEGKYVRGWFTELPILKRWYFAEVRFVSEAYYQGIERAVAALREEQGPTFLLQGEAWAAALAWLTLHNCPSHGKDALQTAIGGEITYTFTPTSLGVVKKVKCACGASCDVSDYQDW